MAIYFAFKNRAAYLLAHVTSSKWNEKYKHMLVSVTQKIYRANNKEKVIRLQNEIISNRKRRIKIYKNFR